MSNQAARYFLNVFSKGISFKYDAEVLGRRLAIAVDEGFENIRKIFLKKRASQALYMQQVQAKSEPFEGCSNNCLPLTAILTDSMIATYAQSLGVEKIKFQATNRRRVKLAERATEYFTWLMRNVAKLSSVLLEWLQDAFILGVGYIYVYYDRKFHYVPYTEKNDKGETTVKFRAVPVYDAVRLVTLEPDCVYLPSDARGVQPDETDRVAFKVQMTQSELKTAAKQGAYANVNKVLDYERKALESELKRQKRKFISGSDIETLMESKKFDIHHIFGKFDANKDGIDEETWFVFHRPSKIILRLAFNPYKFRPIIAVAPFGLPRSFPARGLPEILRPLQDALDTNYNMRNDMVLRALSPYGFYTPGIFEPGENVLVPGGLYPVAGDPSQAVHFPNLPNPPREAYVEENVIWNFAQRQTAIPETKQGAYVEKNKAPTEIMQVMQQSAMRFAPVFQKLYDAFCQLIQVVYEIQKLNMKDTEEYEIHGEFTAKRNKISRQDFNDVVMNIVARNAAEESVKKQLAFNLFQMLLGTPFVQNNPTTFYKLVQWISEMLDIENIMTVLPKPPEADLLAPEKEQELIADGVDVSPDFRENAEAHLRAHESFIDSPEYKEDFPKDLQKALLLHIKNTRILVRVQRSIQQMQQQQPAVAGGTRAQQLGGAEVVAKQQEQAASAQ